MVFNRAIKLGALALGLALIAGLSSRALNASDHDDGEIALKSRNLNLTDLFAFREADQNYQASPDNLIFVLNTNPRSLARQQYYFNGRARYEFKVTRVANKDASPTGREDVTLRFEFRAPDAAGSQGMQVSLVRGSRVNTVNKTTSGALIKTTPLSAAPVLNQLSLIGSPVTVFAGTREDPFFFDVEQFFRVRAGLRGLGPAASFRNPGLDFTAGYNVSSIVVRVPRALLAGQSGATTFDVWETISVPTGDGKGFRQIERLGRPVINEGLVVNNPNLKTLNSIPPNADLGSAAAAARADIVTTLKSLGNSDARVGVLAQAFLPDVMRIDTTGPSGYGNALNALGAPIRGRKLADDVFDTTIQVLTNGAVTGDNVSYAGPNLGGSGHKPLEPNFPYLALPN